MYMVKAMIDIDEHANQILNIVKAKYDLPDKSHAINLAMRQYEEEIMEPEFKPEFVAELKKTEKERRIKVKDFKKEFLS